MAWILFELIDWPATSTLFPFDHDGVEFVLGIAIRGGLQWFLIGLGLQRLVEWGLRRSQKVLDLSSIQDLPHYPE
jgi:hypothetical protein